MSSPGLMAKVEGHWLLIDAAEADLTILEVRILRIPPLLSCEAI